MALPATVAAARAAVRYRVKGTGLYVEPFDSGGAGGLGYDAAGMGRRAASWRVSSAGPNAVLSFALPTLRNRSRDAVRKNPYAESAIASLETNIVGTGIQPQFRTPDPGLNAALGELWLAWTDEADADGRLDYYGLQALVTRGTVEAGEVFTRFRVRRPGDLATVPLQLQVLEPEFVPVDRAILRPGRDIRQGIEIDRVGRRTAYWMLRDHPNDGLAVADPNPVPVPASEVMHVYQLRRPGMLRGEPWLSRALVKLRDLDLYDDAELVRKKVAAMFVAFITRHAEGDDQFGGETDPDAQGIAQLALEPGTAQILGLGEDVKFSEPADVGGSYEPFLRQQLRAVAVAVGTMYELLTGDYSTVNDRTFRASVNEFRRRIGMIQDHMLIHQFCRPTVMRWLDLAVLSGAVALPRNLDPAQLYRVRWIPQGWSYIHPVQEVEADRLAVRAGFKSRAQVVSERGHEPEAIDREIAEDNRRADGLGVRYDSDGRTDPRPAAAGGARRGAAASPAARGEDEDGAAGRDEAEDDDDDDRGEAPGR